MAPRRRCRTPPAEQEPLGGDFAPATYADWEALVRAKAKDPERALRHPPRGGPRGRLALHPRRRAPPPTRAAGPARTHSCAASARARRGRSASATPAPDPRRRQRRDPRRAGGWRHRDPPRRRPHRPGRRAHPRTSTSSTRCSTVSCSTSPRSPSRAIPRRLSCCSSSTAGAGTRATNSAAASASTRSAPTSSTSPVAIEHLKAVRAEFPRLQVLAVDTAAYAEAGAGGVLELALALSSGVTYLRAGEDGGLDPAEVAAGLEFTLAVGPDQFLEIARPARPCAGCGRRCSSTAGCPPPSAAHRCMSARRDACTPPSIRG